MTVEKIKVEVEFKTIEEFEPFEYRGKIYLKLPAFTCKRPVVSMAGPKDWITVDLNAISSVDKPMLSEYEYFKGTALVRPLKAELKIYE